MSLSGQARQVIFSTILTVIAISFLAFQIKFMVGSFGY